MSVSLLRFLVLGIGLAAFCSINPQSASALTGSSWKAGNIISDHLFYDNTSMTTDQIQTFLNSKNPSCDTWGTQPATEQGRPDITHAQYAQLAGFHAPPYICLKDYFQVPTSATIVNNFNPTASRPDGSISAAQIIKNAADSYNVSPKALLVLLHKESAGPLTVDTWPLLNQYRSAMGYACYDTAPCDPQYAGFYNQIMNAAMRIQTYRQYPNSYRHRPFTTNSQVYYNPNLTGCSWSAVYIEGYATAGLYNYTPYQPNKAALDNLYGSGDGCSAYGNRNFWRIYNDWFGPSVGYIYNGVDFSSVFNMAYYLANNPDVQQATGGDESDTFHHFVTYGIKEGRPSSESFNVNSYRNANPDLRLSFGTNLPLYYSHFAVYGKNEGRIATGNVPFQPITSYGGINYASVYDFTYYLSTYPDLAQMYGGDDGGAIRHFVSQGILEGRQANEAFNVNSYRAAYYDLRKAFGSNLRAYYLHYISNGKAEGRVGNETRLGGVSTLGKTNYSDVYDFESYTRYNSDIASVYGSKMDDSGALNHFISFGMSEGRHAHPSFNVHTYKNRYADLQKAFGNNLKAYYSHYINYGKAENRTAN